MRLHEQPVIDLCFTQFTKANNMTDALTALQLLVNYAPSAREHVLGEFYKTWQHDALVVNKWLAVQAMADVPHALDNVQRLMQHQAFDLKNPNKVYALVGGFTRNNPTKFHQADGKAYRFLADVVCELNAINPQVAAKMVQPLIEFAKFDDHRQDKMRAALTQIYNLRDLAPDLLEVVTKALGV
jgi:aminopeptidase N